MQRINMNKKQLSIIKLALVKIEEDVSLAFPDDWVEYKKLVAKVNVAIAKEKN